MSKTTPIPSLASLASKHRKAEQSAKKNGRGHVSITETDIIDAAEKKRERKAAKANRDIARSKAGRNNT